MACTVRQQHMDQIHRCDTYKQFVESAWGHFSFTGCRPIDQRAFSLLASLAPPPPCCPAGLPLDQVQGSRLCEVLECADGEALPTPTLLAAAPKLHAVNIARARLRGTPHTPGSASVFTLRFRAAGRQGLDESTVTLGVPSFLPITGGEDKAQVSPWAQAGLGIRFDHYTWDGHGMGKQAKRTACA